MVKLRERNSIERDYTKNGYYVHCVCEHIKLYHERGCEKCICPKFVALTLEEALNNHTLSEGKYDTLKHTLPKPSGTIPREFYMPKSKSILSRIVEVLKK